MREQLGLLLGCILLTAYCLLLLHQKNTLKAERDQWYDNYVSLDVQVRQLKYQLQVNKKQRDSLITLIEGQDYRIRELKKADSLNRALRRKLTGVYNKYTSSELQRYMIDYYERRHAE